MYKKCNIKNLKKNYQESSFRKILLLKLGYSNFRSFSISTFQEHVFQIIIYMSLVPISEWQADTFSFGFRQKRSAIQPVSIIANQLRTLRTLKPY